MHDDFKTNEGAGINVKRQIPAEIRLGMAVDYHEAYFSAAVPDKLELTLLDGVPEEEELFAFDSPIQLHRFAEDQSGNVWVVKHPSKEKIMPESYAMGKFYDLIQRKLGLPIMEQRTVSVSGITCQVSRFMPNAVDGMYFYRATDELRETARTNLAKLWPVMFLLGQHSDHQFTYTPQGQVSLIDYELNPNYLPEPGRINFNAYGHFIDGVDATIVEDMGQVREVIGKIEAITDEEFEEVCATVPNIQVRSKLKRALIVRRNLIRHAFEARDTFEPVTLDDLLL